MAAPEHKKELRALEQSFFIDIAMVIFIEA